MLAMIALGEGDGALALVLANFDVDATENTRPDAMSQTGMLSWMNRLGFRDLGVESESRPLLFRAHPTSDMPALRTIAAKLER